MALRQREGAAVVYRKTSGVTQVNEPQGARSRDVSVTYFHSGVAQRGSCGYKDFIEFCMTSFHIQSSELFSKCQFVDEEMERKNACLSDASGYEAAGK